MNSPEYSEENVKRLILEAKNFASYVLECVKKHLDDQNLPIDGELSNFDFDLEKNQLTVNHRFIYNDKVRESFHIIPLSILW